MKHNKNKIKKIPEKIKSLSEFISAIIVIGGALIGAGQWIIHEINLSTNARMDAIEQKIDDNQKENKLAILRLELITLMESDPTNVVEIEKVAKSYFSNGGDWYMTSLYSRYAKEYGADTSFVVK